MHQDHKGTAICVFLGLLFIIFSVLGFSFYQNPGNFLKADRYDLAFEQFLRFCCSLRYAFGAVGIPLFLISLIVSIVRKH